MYINTTSTSTFIPNYGSDCSYYLHQAGRGRGDNSIIPIYSNPRFLQRGHGIGIFCWGMAFVRASLAMAGCEGRESEAIVTGRKIITDMV